MSKLEIWCEIYFGHSPVIVFFKPETQLPMEHPLTQTGFLADPKVVLLRCAPPDAAPDRASWLNIPFASGPRLEMARKVDPLWKTIYYIRGLSEKNG
jgi:hypothetical protein